MIAEQGGGGGAERSGAETSLEVGHSGTQGDESSKKERKERGGCCVINITKNMESEGGRERGDTEGDLCSGRRGARQVGGRGWRQSERERRREKV